ncbi:MAG: hypothetical protein V4612_06150 [Pseudomonadota bacterium]
MTQKIKLIPIIILTLFLSNCAPKFKMDKDNFTSLKQDEKIVAFKLKFTYDNKIKSNSQMPGGLSFCRLYFSKDGDFFQHSIHIKTIKIMFL